MTKLAKKKMTSKKIGKKAVAKIGKKAVAKIDRKVERNSKGEFTPGHKKQGGRKKGSKNKTTLMQEWFTGKTGPDFLEDTIDFRETVREYISRGVSWLEKNVRPDVEKLKLSPTQMLAYTLAHGYLKKDLPTVRFVMREILGDTPASAMHKYECSRKSSDFAAELIEVWQRGKLTYEQVMEYATIRIPDFAHEPELFEAYTKTSEKICEQIRQMELHRYRKEVTLNYQQFNFIMAIAEETMNKVLSFNPQLYDDFRFRFFNGIRKIIPSVIETNVKDLSEVIDGEITET